MDYAPDPSRPNNGWFYQYKVSNDAGFVILGYELAYQNEYTNTAVYKDTKYICCIGI